MDGEGHPQFEDLRFHRETPCFFAFDLLMRDGVDLRSAALVDLKQELRRLLASVHADVPIRYVDHIEGKGISLFERVCTPENPGNSRNSATFAPKPDQRKCSVNAFCQALPPFSLKGTHAVRFQRIPSANAIRSETTATLFTSMTPKACT